MSTPGEEDINGTNYSTASQTLTKSHTYARKLCNRSKNSQHHDIARHVACANASNRFSSSAFSFFLSPRVRPSGIRKQLLVRPSGAAVTPLK